MSFRGSGCSLTGSIMASHEIINTLHLYIDRVNDIKVIVFDFDGTLVLSNQLKYDAYYKLFPDDDCHRKIITQVLEQIVEESRFVILEAIVEESRQQCASDIVMDVAQLAEGYNAIVIEGAKNCPTRINAQKVVETLKHSHSLYLSSNTPEIPLNEIVEYRQWAHYFKGVFGYPRVKYNTLQEVLTLENTEPSQVLVVGDGESDGNSAAQAGCKFFYVEEDADLEELLSLLI